MEWGSYAGLISAFFTMVTAIGGAIVSFKVMFPNLRINRHVAKVVDETHVIVNQQRTDMMRFQTVLKNKLAEHGIEIPEDQSTLDT